MYMSKISLNRRRRGAMKLLGSRHAMHAAVMSSFSPGTPTSTEAGRVLWRVDRHDEAVDLLVVSPAEPCLAHINDQAGWSTGATWATRDYKSFLASITEDQEYIFRLAANPTHRISTPADGGVRKQIVGHVTDGHQRQWFLDRTVSNGFSVIENSSNSEDRTHPELVVRDRETVVFRRGSQRVTLRSAVFEGQLRVDDTERLRKALTQGIGRAKGYGCGLLTLLPVS
ncbi:MULTISPECIES: type I-E CRISPR-associated protein Cas6/Cse3/CasE [Dietzia]|jgi:CRISPR system Cascade subunit CasE|uniref:Type I-E CRISPR-associated protein Cas6/Cse3/CasE n=1 Tax=Dietzia maris TaxID=37915 RepID=A0ABT8H0I4_9ACTN|nr:MULTISPECIES: type I-E CRISPR-associated protein Cas6/Cse3/CasE [Dietzia]MBB1017416.1 type I-E CRISPR-associated protein Cas6/Cse3/CasE [Dietzia sp. DQ11-71]MCZ4656456.1 type I-E CRISPR-associated protein Cas6/Cse3/CasE [Dietzia kunjamensis]MDN4505968.1 type I-E CRISPR-associated protein Cas6/Cse3/CasE [Dietzia maris]